MRQHPLRRDRIAGENIARQRDYGVDLRGGKRREPELMAAIDDFDADRTGVDVGLSLPVATAGMPRAERFRHHLDDASVLMNDVVAGDLALRIAQPVLGTLPRFHAGVMQDNHVDGRVRRTVVEVGRRSFRRRHFSPRSFSTAS